MHVVGTEPPTAIGQYYTNKQKPIGKTTRTSSRARMQA
jgi:hypothetical protein